MRRFMPLVKRLVSRVDGYCAGVKQLWNPGRLQLGGYKRSGLAAQTSMSGGVLCFKGSTSVGYYCAILT